MAFGCTGTISEIDPVVPDIVFGATCTEGEVSRSGLRRMSAHQYDNTLHALGLTASSSHLVQDTLGNDVKIGRRERAFSVGGKVNRDAALGIVDIAMTVAKSATEDLPSLVGCSPQDLDAENDCARQFITNFGRRVYRRPLKVSEVDELYTLFEETRGAFDYATGVETILVSMLNSPDFLYIGRTSDAAPGEVIAADEFTIASRLSYFLWDSMPDELLLEAAERGELSDPLMLENQARRMLEHENASQTFHRFIEEWTEVEVKPAVGVDSRSSKFPWFSAELQKDLQTSFERSLEEALGGEDSSLRELLLSDEIWVNDRIAEAYGFPLVGSEELVKVSAGEMRRGMLTHPSFLSHYAKGARSDIIGRGFFVRDQLLCTPPDAPPANDADGNPIVFDIPEPSPGGTNRDAFESHTEDPYCGACHKYINPIGYGFEQFDAVGQFRTQEDSGLTIDATGEIVGNIDGGGEFDGAVELAERLAESSNVADCMARQWFRFAMGRKESAQDACAIRDATERLMASDMSIKEMMVGLAVSEAMRFSNGGE